MQEARSIQGEKAPTEPGFRSRGWQYSYRSSSIAKDATPDDLLHDFYIPALRLATQYDRVAGYFRSTSLAAASQGFTSFIGRQGKMRLIVGADLDPEDVRAILAGDEARMARRLNEELDPVPEWPEDVQRGVTLLAWMVAHGYLDVRVAFRVHAETGEPIPFESDDDGYFHEKWFVMTDAAGNRLYGAGSLNESKTALKHNFENLIVFCDWMGERDRSEVDRAQRDFETLWKGDAPHLAVRKLPDAVRERLIRLADGVSLPVEIDGTRAIPSAQNAPSTLDRLRFALLRDAPKMPEGRFVGLSTAPVDPWPHQEVVVRRLVETWPYSHLLCDEVGLGKTIEAGLAFRCLYLSGIVKRILIAAPASLTEQWLRQMAAKVLMPFGKAAASPEIRHDYSIPTKRQVPASSLFTPDLVILSTGLLARRERAQGLRSATPFDIVLIDEAHAARRSNATQGTAAHPDYVQLYKNVQDFVRPATRSLWLATATPMQLHPVEVCDLIALTNRVGAFQYAPRLTLEYYDILGRLVRGGTVLDTEWAFLQNSLRSLEVQDPFLWQYLQDWVIPASSARILEQWLSRGRIPRGYDLKILQRVLFSASPLSRVMMRHTRELLGIYREKGQLKQNLARRHIQKMKGITFSEPERRIYEQLEEYCKGLTEQVPSGSSTRSRNMMQFFLSFLRLRFASSLFAIEQTLRRRLARVEATLAYQSKEEQIPEDQDYTLEAWLDDDSEDDIFDVDALLKDRSQKDLQWERERLQSMLRDIDNLTGMPSKMVQLLRILDERKQDGRIKQTVIFTRFYDTLKDIVRRLRTADPYMRIGTYSGQGAEYYDPKRRSMQPVDREEVKALFLRGEIDVLVCTDAAAEGLNLQTADMLINFDLGWNPMKIEQRIGRIDRIGQRHNDIYVVNLCYAGSAEEKVYGRLLERLEDANMIVGTQQISILPVTSEDFRRLAEGSLSEDELHAQAMERIREQRERNQSMELPANELYDIYSRMTADKATQRAPVDRTSIWRALTESEYLRSLGCKALDDDRPVFCVKGIKGVPDGARFTVSPELYESGLPDWEGRLHFASYGDPYFDSLLDHMTEYKLPGCIRRLHVPLPTDHSLEMVAYAVACRTASGATEVRLVRSWDDLDDLNIADDITLNDEEIEPLRRELRHIIRQEYRLRQVVEQIEKENVRSATLERLLELAVIKDLIEECSVRVGENASSGSVFREVEALYETRSTVQARVPAEPFRGEELLFDLRLMKLPDYVNVSAPRLLSQAGLDAAKALADSLKARGGSVRARTLVSRLEREMTGLMRELRSAG